MKRGKIYLWGRILLSFVFIMVQVLGNVWGAGGIVIGGKDFVGSVLGYVPSSQLIGLKFEGKDNVVFIWREGRSGKDVKKEKDENIKFFLTTLAVPDKDLWVNLDIRLTDLEVMGLSLWDTDVGKVMLWSDVRLKEDVRKIGNRLGIWDEIVEYAYSLCGDKVNWVFRPRFWIVPGPIEVFVDETGIAIKNAKLDVKCEIQRVKNGDRYQKELERYAYNLIRQRLLPELRYIINNSVRYALLRQVYNACILAQWYKRHLKGSQDLFDKAVDSLGLNGIKSKQLWNPRWYLDEYAKMYYLSDIEGGNNWQVSIGGEVFDNVTEKAITSRVTDVTSAIRNMIGKIKQKIGLDRRKISPPEANSQRKESSKGIKLWMNPLLTAFVILTIFMILNTGMVYAWEGNPTWDSFIQTGKEGQWGGLSWETSMDAGIWREIGNRSEEEILNKDIREIVSKETPFKLSKGMKELLDLKGDAKFINNLDGARKLFSSYLNGEIQKGDTPSQIVDAYAQSYKIELEQILLGKLSELLDQGLEGNEEKIGAIISVLERLNNSFENGPNPERFGKLLRKISENFGKLPIPRAGESVQEYIKVKGRNGKSIEEIVDEFVWEEYVGNKKGEIFGKDSDVNLGGSIEGKSESISMIKKAILSKLNEGAPSPEIKQFFQQERKIIEQLKRKIKKKRKNILSTFARNTTNMTIPMKLVYSYLQQLIHKNIPENLDSLDGTQLQSKLRFLQKVGELGKDGNINELIKREEKPSGIFRKIKKSLGDEFKNILWPRIDDVVIVKTTTTRESEDNLTRYGKWMIIGGVAGITLGTIFLRFLRKKVKARKQSQNQGSSSSSGSSQGGQNIQQSSSSMGQSQGQGSNPNPIGNAQVNDEELEKFKNNEKKLLYADSKELNDNEKKAEDFKDLGVLVNMIKKILPEDDNFNRFAEWVMKEAQNHNVRIYKVKEGIYKKDGTVFLAYADGENDEIYISPELLTGDEKEAVALFHELMEWAASRGLISFVLDENTVTIHYGDERQMEMEVDISNVAEAEGEKWISLARDGDSHAFLRLIQRAMFPKVDIPLSIQIILEQIRKGGPKVLSRIGLNGIEIPEGITEQQMQEDYKIVAGQIENGFNDLWQEYLSSLPLADKEKKNFMKEIKSFSDIEKQIAMAELFVRAGVHTRDTVIENFVYYVKKQMDNPEWKNAYDSIQNFKQKLYPDLDQLKEVVSRTEENDVGGILFVSLLPV